MAKPREWQDIEVTDTDIMAKKFGFKHEKILLIAERMIKTTRGLESEIVENIYKKSKHRRYLRYELTEKGYLTILFETVAPSDKEISWKLATEKKKYIKEFLTIQNRNEKLKLINEKLKEELEILKTVIGNNFAKERGLKNLFS